MAKRKKRQTNKPRYKVPPKCAFCDSKTIPSYKEAEVLKKFLTDRGKILGKDRNGLCSRHQRLLSREIKRARHLGLLPFAPVS